MTSNESNSFSGRGNQPSSSDDRLSSLFSSITAEYAQLKETSGMTAANFRPSFSNRHASKVLPVRPEVQLDRIVSIADQLQSFLLLIPKQQQPKQLFNRNGFSLERHSDMVLEIVLHLGSIITSNSKPELLAATFRIDDQYKLYLRYAQLITNLAEKSVSIAILIKRVYSLALIGLEIINGSLLISHKNKIGIYCIQCPTISVYQCPPISIKSHSM